MSITYELLKDNDNWSYLLTIDIDYKLSKKDKDTLDKLTDIIKKSIRILNYRGN
jgi:hypothetical protein